MVKEPRADLKTVLYLFKLAFLEIRATDDINKARIIADIFHNIPAYISSGRSKDEIEKEIISKSERHGFSSFAKNAYSQC